MSTRVDFELSRFSPQYIYDGRFRRGSKTRAVVLARAIEVASTEGLEGLTIGRLATDLGMSKGHLTVLFPSKEALQIATLDAAMARFADEVVARAERARSSRTRVGGLCDAWFRYVARRVFPGGCFLYATANEYRARPGAIRDRVREHRAAWNRCLANAIGDGQRTGRIRRGIDVADLVVELTSYQAGANLAALLGDRAAFRRAARATRVRLRRLADAGATPAIALRRR
ncbi:MAG: TetR/AcrR family transcriptional regulator [Candidatus Binatia bacterium]